MVAPTGRNRLFELFMQGTNRALQGQEPEQTGYLMPLARYEGGGVAPAVPGAVSDIVAAMQGGMSQDPSDFNSPSPEVRESYDRDALIDALVVGGAATTGGLAVPKPTNSVGIFGGRLAKTADQNALAKAEAMQQQGLPREQIWDETGWFQGVDGKWRFEIDDSNATVNAGRGSGFDGPVQHPGMQAAYPDSRVRYDVRTNYEPTSGASEGAGAYNPAFRQVQVRGVSPEDARSIALHETQHHVQRSEGFAPGGSADRMGDTDFGEVRDKILATSAPSEFVARRSSLEQLTPEQKADLAYWALAGEAEARAVQARRNLTPDQRRSRAPWADFDVPEAQQIVRD